MLHAVGFTQAACSPLCLLRTVSVNHSGCQWALEHNWWVLWWWCRS